MFLPKEWVSTGMLRCNNRGADIARTNADGGHGEGAGVVDLEGQREDSPHDETHRRGVEPRQHSAQQGAVLL